RAGGFVERVSGDAAGGGAEPSGLAVGDLLRDSAEQLHRAERLDSGVQLGERVAERGQQLVDADDPFAGLEAGPLVTLHWFPLMPRPRLAARPSARSTGGRVRRRG